MPYQFDMFDDATVIDPKSLNDMRVGEPVAVGFQARWTLLARIGFKEHDNGRVVGFLLTVRPHRYHSFVTQQFTIDPIAGFYCYAGTYHETLSEAIATYLARSGDTAL